MRRAFCYAHGMVGEMLGGLSDPRIRSYRMVIVGETGRSADSVSDSSVQSLYLWQVAVASAWYEALSPQTLGVMKKVNPDLGHGWVSNVTLDTASWWFSLSG